MYTRKAGFLHPALPGPTIEGTGRGAMAIDLTLLSKKHFITLKELDCLLFHSLEILQNKIKGSLGRSFRKEVARSEGVQYEFKGLVKDALEAGSLGYVSWHYNDSPFNGGLFVKFEKDVIFAWLLEENILGWLNDEGVEVSTEVKELIGRYAKEETTISGNEEIHNDTEREALIFLRKADFWEIGIQETKHFRHKKGLSYLQFLLLHPRKNYSCHEIQQIELGYEVSAKRHFEKDPEYVAPPSESIEENAKKMKEDIAEMKRALDEAKGHNSPDVTILERELNEDVKLYNQLYDNCGRPRNVGSQDEKVRKAVGKALREAKDAILKELPDLEPILDKVTSGKELGYFPEDQPIEVFTSSLQK